MKIIPTYQSFVSIIQSHINQDHLLNTLDLIPENYIDKLITNNKDENIDYIYCNCLWEYITITKQRTIPNWYMKYFDIAFNRLMKDIDLLYRFFRRTFFMDIQLNILQPYIDKTIEKHGSKFINYSFRQENTINLYFFYLFHQYYKPKHIRKFFSILPHTILLLQFDKLKFIDEESQQTFDALLNLYNMNVTA